MTDIFHLSRTHRFDELLKSAYRVSTESDPLVVHNEYRYAVQMAHAATSLKHLDNSWILAAPVKVAVDAIRFVSWPGIFPEPVNLGMLLSPDLQRLIDANGLYSQVLILSGKGGLLSREIWSSIEQQDYREFLERLLRYTLSHQNHSRPFVSPILFYKTLKDPRLSRFMLNIDAIAGRKTALNESQMLFSSLMNFEQPVLMDRSSKLKYAKDIQDIVTREIIDGNDLSNSTGLLNYFQKHATPLLANYEIGQRIATQFAQFLKFQKNEFVGKIQRIPHFINLLVILSRRYATQSSMTAKEYQIVLESLRSSNDIRLESEFWSNIDRHLKDMPKVRVISLFMYYLYQYGPQNNKTLFVKRKLLSFFGQQRNFKYTAKRIIPRINTGLKIGLITGEIRRHAVAKFISPLFSNCFETHVLSLSKEDDVTAKFKHRAARWTDISSDFAPNLQDQANLLTKEVDLLIDLSGISSNSVSGRYRTSQNIPIVGYIGGVATTERFLNDFFIVDSYLNYDNILENQFDERLINLDSIWLRYESHLIPVNSSTRDKNTIAIVGDFKKIGRRTFELMGFLLESDPKLKIVIVSQTMNLFGIQRLLNCLPAIDQLSARLQFDMRILSYTEHLERYNHYAAVLDTHDYVGAGTSAFDAVMMGVPVITTSGKTYLTRMAGAISFSLGWESFTISDGIIDGEKWIKIRDQLAEWDYKKASNFARFDSQISDIESGSRSLNRAFETILAS